MTTYTVYLIPTLGLILCLTAEALGLYITKDR